MLKTWCRRLTSERFGAMQDFEVVTAGYGCSGSCGIAATSGYSRVVYETIAPSMKEFIASAGRLPTQRPRIPRRRMLSWSGKLWGLPLEYREVLVLRELEELSYLEIASITRIPLGTVVSRLSSSRKRLQLSLLNLPAGGNPDQPSIALDGSVATLIGAGDRDK